MGTVATLYEVNQAKTFLRLIGAPANNNQTILAVVAFMRVVDSYNARVLAQRIIDRSTADLYNFTPLLVPGGLPTDERQALIDYNAAGEAKEDQINAERKEDASWYKLALTAARHGRAGDFLYALALSGYSSTHFGGYNSGAIDPSRNRLLRTYSSFTGLTLPPPPTPKQEAAPKPKARRMPKVPTVLQPPSLVRSYLDPDAARRFYNARHLPPPKS
jgi:hypothetical protein